MNKLPIYKTEGIILKAADWGDLDRLLTIYTSGYGKIQARAISARRKGSKLNGLLQNFIFGQFLLAKSKTVDIITDLEVINNYQYLHGHLENLAHAFYFSELIDKLIPAPERDDDVWRLVARAFEVLDNPILTGVKNSDLTPTLSLSKERGQKRINFEQIKILFEDKLVEFLGHGKMDQVKSVQRLNYLQSLAGERINSQKFLAQIH